MTSTTTIGAVILAVLLVGGITVGVASDSAVPGDPTYGLDRALEWVGIGAGGAAERLEEAAVLLERGELVTGLRHGAAGLKGLEIAGTATSVRDAAGALSLAAQAVETLGLSRVEGLPGTARFRSQVAGLLGELSEAVASGEVDGREVAETATELVSLARELVADLAREAPGALPEGLRKVTDRVLGGD